MPFDAAQFRAMGTMVEVLAAPTLPEGRADQIARFFQSVEKRLSRFRPDSELSRLNRSAGAPFRPSPILRRVLAQALDAARRSAGLYDPTVLDALEASGYDRPFHTLAGQPGRSGGPAPARYQNVTLLPGGSVVLRDGVRIDLGGFAKGWTVDAAARLMRDVASWVINAGGDLRAAGPGPDGCGWLVGIEDPWTPGNDIAVLRVRDQAVATSSLWRRRWSTSQGWAHHLIDPRSGRPADTGLAAVTVVAPTAAQAEVFTKTVLLLGPCDGLSYIESLPDCAAALVAERGGVIWSRRMEGLRAA